MYTDPNNTVVGACFAGQNGQRTYVDYFLSSASPNILSTGNALSVSTTAVQVLYGGMLTDTLGEYDGTSFKPKNAGLYQFNVSLAFGSIQEPENASLDLQLVVSGTVVSSTFLTILGNQEAVGMTLTVNTSQLLTPTDVVTAQLIYDCEPRRPPPLNCPDLTVAATNFSFGRGNSEFQVYRVQ